MHNSSQIAFHKMWLNHVKQSIGASYVAYEEYGGLFNLKAVIKGEEFKFKLNGTPQDVSAESYKEIINHFLGV